MGKKLLWAPWRMGYINGEKETGCLFCRKAAGKDGDMGETEIAAVSQQAGEKMRGVYLLRQVLETCRARRALLARRDAQKPPGLKALFAERLKLQEELIAATWEMAGAAK